MKFQQKMSTIMLLGICRMATLTYVAATSIPLQSLQPAHGSKPQLGSTPAFMHHRAFVPADFPTIPFRGHKHEAVQPFSARLARFRSNLHAVQMVAPTRKGAATASGDAPKEARKNQLVFMDDTWRQVSESELEAAAEAGADVSAASITEMRTEGSELVEWEVESPITFQYRVKEVPDVLDPDSKALLFGHLTDVDQLMKALNRPLKRVVVVDSEVYRLFGDRIDNYFVANDVQYKMMVLPTVEENKNMEMVLQIAKAIDEFGIDRRLDPVITIGGGVCMDIAGFAASLYRRRTPYIRVPTTLMGYVDASVGAKTGVNFNGKKNKMGAYIPPALTLLDRSFMATQDQRQISNGAAEIMKMALVKDAELYRLLETYGPHLIDGNFQDLPEHLNTEEFNVPIKVLQLSISTMLEELAPNLWEDSLTRQVDFGHIFSMELEMAALHSEKLWHGEAVAIDMAFCTVLAFVRGQISESERDRILDTMRGLKVPLWSPLQDTKMVSKAMYERVKFSQGQKVPLPVACGSSRIFNDITEEQLHDAVQLWDKLCSH